MAKKKISTKDLLIKYNELLNVYHEELLRIYEDDIERAELLNNIKETLDKKFEQVNGTK